MSISVQIIIGTYIVMDSYKIHIFTCSKLLQTIQPYMLNLFFILLHIKYH